MLLLLMSTFITSMMFIFFNHPLSFGLTLLIQTLITALITGMLSYNFWFSYILFLIMVGGMLILFIYMTSIASNEKFKFSSKMMTTFIMLTLMLSFILLVTDYYMFNIKMTMKELADNQIIFQQSMSKFLNWPSNLIFIMITIYLLMTLIAVVKITNIKYGPLRQKF